MSKMTLDEAIDHSKELSEDQSVCEDCREEHKQLAEWLEELKEYKIKECEMTASEMFERLGFTRNLNSGKLIYTKNLKGMFRYLDITFDLTAKEIELYNDREAYTVSNALLKAIDKQAEELGWPDEKPTYKLSQFEYDLINAFDRCKECCLLNEIECLKKLIEKGYFKGIDPFTKVHDIIDNCEVVG